MIIHTGQQLYFVFLHSAGLICPQPLKKTGSLKKRLTASEKDWQPSKEIDCISLRQICFSIAQVLPARGAGKAEFYGRFQYCIYIDEFDAVRAADIFTVCVRQDDCFDAHG